MKSIVVSDFGSPDVLSYLETDMPAVGPSQVLIRVAATSVNFADIKARYGRYHGASKPPFTPGLDVAGVVEAVGCDVHEIKVGQRVIGFPKNGSYAEYTVCDESLTFTIPDKIDFDIAAACPLVSFTAYKLLADVAHLQPGEIVLIHAAAGGIGTTASQIAKILGAATVIGTVGTSTKESAAREAGADQVIAYEGVDFAAKVNELTSGRGVDVILDSIGGTVAEQSMACLARYGRLVHFGSASGEVGHIRTTDLHASCRSVLGFSLGTTLSERPGLVHSTAQQVLGYLASGRLKMKIGARFPLAEAADAHRLMESRQSMGKILLTVENV